MDLSIIITLHYSKFNCIFILPVRFILSCVFLLLISILSFQQELPQTPLHISCKAGMVVMNSFSFCLYGKLSFNSEGQLCSIQYYCQFFFQHFWRGISFLSLLACKASAKKSADGLMECWPAGRDQAPGSGAAEAQRVGTPPPTALVMLFKVLLGSHGGGVWSTVRVDWPWLWVPGMCRAGVGCWPWSWGSVTADPS